MYINTMGYYVPEKRIPNSYFQNINGITSDWIYQRTGILTRSRATEKETIDYMSIKAVENALPELPYPVEEVDLIIFASYTPSDTIGTTGHVIQREFGMTRAKTFLISSACSSAINAIEIIKSFFETGISSKALLICADRNSTYSDESDCASGHLWGDAAVSVFFSRNPVTGDEPELIDVNSQGLGHVGHGPHAVSLNPATDGLHMPFGKDVFMHACTYITQNTKDILEKNRYTLDELNYFIAHQANMRIIKNVSRQLGIPDEKILSNIEELGNTGSASAPLVFAQNKKRYKKGDLVCLSVFGGGYSAGACLVKFK